MESVINLVFFAVGLVILIKSSNWLVDGASSLAVKYKISPMVVGLIVVAFGTSSPELVVSVTSAIEGKTAVAFSNITGSTIANILLILGTAAIFKSLYIHKNTVWKEIPMSFLGALVVTILGLQLIVDSGRLDLFLFGSEETVGLLTFSNGLILLSFFIIFIYYTFGIAKAASKDEPDIKEMPKNKSVFFIAGGIIGLVIGSKLMIDNAVMIASQIGVSESLIGLTLVAVGSSLPEFAATVTAALKNRAELAVGNIIGSNIFNIFFVLGITALVKPIPLKGDDLQDIIIVLGATLILFTSFFLNKKRFIDRREGVFMLLLYAGYIVFIIYRG